MLGKMVVATYLALIAAGTVGNAQDNLARIPEPRKHSEFAQTQTTSKVPIGTIESGFTAPPIPAGMFRVWCATSAGNCPIDVQIPIGTGSPCFCRGDGQEVFSGLVR